jgi:apolipoprotein N-acyltransferase
MSLTRGYACSRRLLLQVRALPLTGTAACVLRQVPRSPGGKLSADDGPTMTSLSTPGSGRPWWFFGLLGVGSAVLLDLPFPLAGPLPAWRAVVAFFALVPLLLAVLRAGTGRRALQRAALAGYSCGVLWYGLNCYWIYATMNVYGGVPPLASAGILVLFSLILGLYFALFAVCVAALRWAFGRVLPALLLAPVVWVAVEYLAAHLTSVPWDQLGYSQVDNPVLTALAPWTGVYGISLVVLAVNCVWLGAWYAPTPRRRLRFVAGGMVLACALMLGLLVQPAASPHTSKAVLLQENLSVGADMADDNEWVDRPGDPEWTRHTSAFLQLSESTCTPYLLGMPQPSPQRVVRLCPGTPPPAALVIWPEAPSPLINGEARTEKLLSTLAAGTGATAIVGAPTVEPGGGVYNSAMVRRPDGSVAGRYDKIHLVPFGEYVPFAHLLTFANNLTHNVGRFSPGVQRGVFALPDGHRFGVFICYESVFASEVRHFADNGAEVLVNISDDGWYGDTSAPWQHLNMARMRAIENRRWILRDTNSGVTASIDPQGRVVESVARHTLTSLTADYGYRADRTFYTRFGDVFAALCEIITAASIAWAVREIRKKTGTASAERS